MWAKNRHRADSDYFARLYSMILDQLEYVSSDGSGNTELFQLESGSYTETGDLTKAKEFVLGYWKKFASDGKERRFKVVPVRFWAVLRSDYLSSKDFAEIAIAECCMWLVCDLFLCFSFS